MGPDLSVNVWLLLSYLDLLIELMCIIVQPERLQNKANKVPVDQNSTTIVLDGQCTWPVLNSGVHNRAKQCKTERLLA